MALHPDNDETVAMAGAPSTARPSSNPHDQRFAPGTLLASRYRIVSRLGKGGMGEVFRADDIMLGQPVALKFLPESARGNVNLLTRFYDEVRIARQISHPNVCRVYDIGEIEGQPYLSMEYIDGEDLSSLLRRIGRLPGDKAAEFARKMCAGLAAAHAQGVLHRDIKPGNIMIDGRGEPRITDFGLAAFGATVEGNEIRNGTPAYMAPEQLEGREVTAQSDLYALGLVFHEMFTGKLAHDAETVAELTRIRKTSSVTNASTLVADLDPAADRAIRACLEPDPKLRPKSALELARMLPGGDPLAAALAAGQTPSPELVAAAGSTETLSPKRAALVLGALFVGLAIVAVVLPTQVTLPSLPLRNSGDVLTDRARTILRTAGYTEPAADSASGFSWDNDFTRHMRTFVSGPEQWKDVLGQHPSPLSFWYRESRRSLMPTLDTEGEVLSYDPSMWIEGMTRVFTGLDGELVWFEAVPPHAAKPPAQSPVVDWKKFFDMARLDISQFQPATPEWTTLLASEQRLAWTGKQPVSYKKPIDIPIRVEAASFHGRPVYFQVIYPWTQASRAADPPKDSNEWSQRVIVGLMVVVLALTAGTAYLHWRTGRGDLKGAVRVGCFVAACRFVAWLLAAHHGSIDFELEFIPEAIATALWEILVYCAMYLAIEPWVRRFWPQVLVVWARLLQGRATDPMVGRDILYGVTTAIYFALYIAVSNAWLRGITNTPPEGVEQRFLTGFGKVMVHLAWTLHGGVSSVLIFLLLMFVLRLALRKPWLATAAFIAVGAFYQTLSSSLPGQYNFPLMVGTYAIAAWVLLRWGMFACIVLIFATNLHGPIQTTDYSAWYGVSSWVSLVLLACLGLWGYRVATSGKSIFGEAPTR